MSIATFFHIGLTGLRKQEHIRIRNKESFKGKEREQIMGIQKEMIGRTRSYVLASTLPEEMKDNLCSLLDAAEVGANGVKDKQQALADTLLMMVIHEVKKTVREPDAFRKLIAEHATACPFKAPTGKWGYVYIMRWPLTVVILVLGTTLILSPHFPQVLEMLKAKF